VCLMREALEARTIDEAIKIVSHPKRAGGYHYYFAQNNKIVSVETSAAKIKKLTLVEGNGQEFGLHNNCYLDPELNRLDPSNQVEIKAEKAIQQRGEKLLRQAEKLDLPAIKKILKFHPGICTHQGKIYHSETINSFIADLDNKAIWIGQGRACQTEYQKFSF
jgi:hypothetical protein